MLRRDKMKEEAECVEAIFLSYINIKSSQNMFLFFEGKDDFKYYCPRLSSINNDKEYKKYDCNGKENVIKVHNMIVNQTASDNHIIKMFFVDRDFDDNSLIDRGIYVTPTYSIENLFFTDVAIKNMIIGEMGLSEHSKEDEHDFNIAFKYMIDYRDNVIKDMLYGNACYSLQIRKAYEKGCGKPNLLPIKKYDKIKNISMFEDIKSMIEDYIEVSELEIKEECERLTKDPIRLLRGKYLLEKMPKCINKIVEESNKGTKYSGHFFSKKRHMCLNVSESTLISDLSSYAETPECLISYIKEKCATI